MHKKMIHNMDKIYIKNIVTIIINTILFVSGNQKKLHIILCKCKMKENKKEGNLSFDYKRENEGKMLQK